MNSSPHPEMFARASIPTGGAGGPQPMRGRSPTSTRPAAPREIDPFLRARLRPLARRQWHLRLACRLALCWLATALLGAALAMLFRAFGAGTSGVLSVVAGAGCVTAFWLLFRQGRAPTDWPALARAVEARHAQLDGRLVTAVEQETAPGVEPSYLQRRLVNEAMNHSRAHDWRRALPRLRVATAHLAHLLALALVVYVFLGLRSLPRARAPLRLVPAGVTVTPGDTTLERGQSLVVMARFGGSPPAGVDLVLDPAGGARRVPLVKSLADPLFGGTVPEVTSNLVYRLEYGGQRTRDYHVSVFEPPRLERADAAITYPDYTRLAPRRIENTRRVSAVEGARLDLAFQFNKPVVSARLVPTGGEGATLQLRVETNGPAASLTGLPLTASRTYDLRLVDADGRTNKVPAQFVLNAVTNRVPELKLVSPRGDLRPSPLEEILFEGRVWDDFGVEAYGLAYTLVGQETQSVELGRSVPANEPRSFQRLLRLEDLRLEPDQLIAWHVWADDLGPDGQVRRTVGDLFFGEVRPFDEVFREGQGRDNASRQQAGNEPSEEGGNPSARLAELQKQIISATWKLRREQVARAPTVDAGPRNDKADDEGKPAASGSYAQDATVVRDSQEQALKQAEAAREEVEDPRTAAFWQTVTDRMEAALDHLNDAVTSPQPLPAALAAEQAAYQALLKLQQREYEVARGRRNQRGQQAGGRQQQMQRQLDQLDLTQSEDRYETERQAQAPQTQERREQLQVLNRLQELARRQQDLNERLQELQTALQEARSEQERQEVRRQLKRLQEEEEQMLADADELRQRLDRPENQSRLAEQRQPLEQARQEMQRAAEAAGQGAVSQALASGTRAQRQLQQARDDLRRESAGEFSEELRALRAGARELSRQQSEIDQQLDALADPQRKNLSDAPERQNLLDRLAQQKTRLTNVTDRATQLSRQTEEAEPLVSRELYDSLRKFSQDEAATVPQLQEELLERGILTQRLYDHLRETAERDGAKSLEATAEMVRQNYLPQANRAEERARAGITDLRRGLERAAERVLGDDTQALRLAQRELEALTDALEREMARAQPGETNAIAQVASENAPQRGRERPASQPTANQAPARQPGQPEQARADQPGNQRTPSPGEDQPQPSDATGPRQANAGPGEARREGTPTEPSAREGQRGERAGRTRLGGPPEAGPGGTGGLLADTLDRLFDPETLRGTGPLTGEDFGAWSDRLREVEELVDLPSWRSEVAQARERARRLRVEYRRDLKKPDWAVVRLEVVHPLVEVRQQIAEELARREPKDNLVPIDRDPVPSRFSELVRRYYEDLGKDKSGGAR